ncbi:MAG: glycosyltransferase [Rhodospirillaceae bacterium]|nr:glycosyltransferase [Rhodospirillaceae bacterium]
MRFMQIASFYPAYLHNFYGRNPALAEQPFQAQIDALLADGFGAGHLIAPAMAGVGFDPLLIITNCVQSQTRWAIENGVPAPRSSAELTALVAQQIEMYQPDVLYVLDPIAFDGRFISSLRVRPRLVVGWRAANIPAGVTWVGYDVMLSSDEGCRRRALEIGARHAAFFRPGFPRSLAARVADAPKNADIVFCGQITVEHQQRLIGMQELVQALQINPSFTAALHLGIPPTASISPLLKKHDKGAVWGLDMYRAVRGGRIAPNFHIDLAVTKNQNMRILETLGVGTFLLTEFDPTLHETFDLGREVETYTSVGEMAEKVRHYLKHDQEREAIAKAGQARCFADHSHERRAETLAGLIGQYMSSAAPKSATSAQAPDVAALLPIFDPQIKTALGHLVNGRIDEAANLLNAAVQRDNTNALALYLLGRVAFLVGEAKSASDLFHTALALKLAPEIAWLCAADLSAAFVKLGQANEAVQTLRQAYALKPKNAEVALRLITLLNQTGGIDEAALLAERAKQDANPIGIRLDALMDLRKAGLVDAAPTSTMASAPKPSSSNAIDLTKEFPGVSFGLGVQALGIDSLRIGRGTVVGDGTWLNVCLRDGQARMVIGECVLVGRRAMLSSMTYLEIGDHTIFGPNVYVASSAHEYEGNHLQPILMCGVRDLGRVVVEENCWLGTNVVVDGNITIGRGSVVGANSVVRHSMPPFSVAVGAPAKIVRMLNPETEKWESVATEADMARMEAARKRKPFPDRATYKEILRKANGGRGLDPVVGGFGIHMR